MIQDSRDAFYRKRVGSNTACQFNRTVEDSLEQEDLESALNSCLTINMPGSYLLWRYRFPVSCWRQRGG